MELFDKPETMRDLIGLAVTVDRTIKAMKGGVADQLLRFAKESNTVEEFIGACTTEEEWIKSSDAGDLQTERLPDCWTQAKSDIKGAWSKGLDPKKYTTYSKLKQAKVALGKTDAPKADKPKPATTDKPKGDNKPGRASNDPRNGNSSAKDDDAVADVTRDEALASGEVVYANSTQIVPDYLLKTAKMLAALPDTPFRAKAVKNVEAAAKMAHDMHFSNKRAGNKQRGKPQAVAA